jgi:outer membrane protein assembly factor BamB
VFFGGGDGWLYAFDAQPVKEDDLGMLKTVWKYDCNPPEYKLKDGKPIKYPAFDGPSEVNATPVIYKNRIYVPIGQDPEHGEGVGRLVCVDATGSGDVTATKTVWDYRGIHRSISTVSIDPATGLLFVGDFSGYVHCLDAESGQLYWTHDMKAHMWGSTLVADGKVYVGDEDGDFAVLAAAKEKKLVSETNVNAPIYGTPIVANGAVYMQSNTHLFSFYDTERAKVGGDQGR